MLRFLYFHDEEPHKALRSSPNTAEGFFYDRLDFFPEHFHFARDRRSGEFGFLTALGCFFI